MEYKDYYKILGIKRDAERADVKRAYQKLARKYHPDLSKEKESEERFKEVNEAYHALKDPKKRKAYDQLGASWQQGQQFKPPPQWSFHSNKSGFNQKDSIPGGFSDFFSFIFGGRDSEFHSEQRNRQQRGHDLHANFHIRLEDAFTGGKKTLTLTVPEQNSKGGVEQKTRTFNVQIPPGIREGQQVRLAGQGGSGIESAPKGDLYLRILYKPHRYFHAEGSDIYLELPVTPWETALGGQISVPTLAGTVMLNIPAGAQSGLKLRLKGKGLPGRLPGAQYVILRLVTPPAENEEARSLYRQMAETMPFNPREPMGL
ncbi:MAG: DnaJ C-terminal domain-containing protein [Amphritea sp.]